MSVAIQFENISKQYRLGLVSTRTLSHDLNRWWTVNILKKEDPYLKIGDVNDRSSAGESEYVWALRNIDFEVNQGDVLGIIGKNGAGKSTLLKILSRVTTPTTGVIRAKGRIASLLEVGTGFHPEMTGRENIYMNGAIMGMTKAEIRRKLDEIVAFAGVARYIDTPAKRYSSGMTVRLGFAVAAHLEPEILVVDEVLAVGDADFQKKAVGKMKDVSRNDGRTVLFVSHNMAAVKSLCTRGIVLTDGQISHVGDTDTVVGAYLKGDNDVLNHKIWEKPEIADSRFELLEIGIRAKGKDYTDVMRVDDELVFNARYRVKERFDSLHLTLHFKDEQGNKLFSTSWGKSGVSNAHDPGAFEAQMRVPENFFNWGTFFIDLFVVKDRKHALYVENDIISFTLANKTKGLGGWMGREPGSITPHFDWQKERIG
jgi:lipopolysaccharide transport system ATP-binding protein